MDVKNKNKRQKFKLGNKDKYIIISGDSSVMVKKIPNNYIKLFYGSPPYPNAKRDYETWKDEEYIKTIIPFIKNALPKLRDDGFIVINVKANRSNPKDNSYSSERSLVVEKLMIEMKEKLNLYCVDIEIWIKSNPVPTGVRVACQDAYEYNLWFSKSPKWEINIDSIRRRYSKNSLKIYKNTEYKARKAGDVQYVSRDKKIEPHEKGALPLNIITNEFKNMSLNLLNRKAQSEVINNETNIVYGAVSGKSVSHQAVQPEYLPEKYILACTDEGDIVYDPWLGSGTTGTAALRLKRKFIGIEIVEQFVKVAKENINETIKALEKE